MGETEMARKITELERKLVEERQETERERLKVINYANLVAIKEKSIAGLKEKLAASEQDLIDYRNEAMKIHFERNKRLHKLEAVITQVRIAILNGTNIPPEARDFIVSTMKPSGDGKDGRETQVAARREKKVPETRKGDEAAQGDATVPLIPPAPETPGGKSCSDCRWEDECRNYKSEEPRASCGPAYKHFTPKLTPAPEASEGKVIWLEYGTCCKQCVCYKTTPRGKEPCVSCMAARSKFKPIKDDCMLHRPFDTCVGVEGGIGAWGHCSPGKYPFCPNRASVPDPEPPEGEHKNCPECGWCPICGDTNCNTRK
jgi:hypothetical protein